MCRKRFQTRILHTASPIAKIAEATYVSRTDSGQRFSKLISVWPVVDMWEGG